MSAFPVCRVSHVAFRLQGTIVSSERKGHPMVWGIGMPIWTSYHFNIGSGASKVGLRSSLRVHMIAMAGAASVAEGSAKTFTGDSETVDGRPG